MWSKPKHKAYTRPGSQHAIWTALLIAFGLHFTIFFLPKMNSRPLVGITKPQLELQLLIHKPAPVQPPVAVEPEEFLPPEVESPPETQVRDKPTSMTQAETKTEPVLPRVDPLPNIVIHNVENLDRTEKIRLTSSILASQFITTESATDKIFGKQLARQTEDPQSEFHIPVKRDMNSILDQPLPDMPFAYTSGLVRFAYEPGVKGDFQRFMDKITPEFGWRTKKGTQFKCVWVLVIAACGWKKLPTAVSARHLQRQPKD